MRPERPRGRSSITPGHPSTRHQDRIGRRQEDVKSAGSPRHQRVTCGVIQCLGHGGERHVARRRSWEKRRPAPDACRGRRGGVERVPGARTRGSRTRGDYARGDCARNDCARGACRPDPAAGAPRDRPRPRGRAFRVAHRRPVGASRVRGGAALACRRRDELDGALDPRSRRPQGARRAVARSRGRAGRALVLPPRVDRSRRPALGVEAEQLPLAVAPRPRVGRGPGERGDRGGRRHGCRARPSGSRGPADRRLRRVEPRRAAARRQRARHDGRGHHRGAHRQRSRCRRSRAGRARDAGQGSGLDRPRERRRHRGRHRLGAHAPRPRRQPLARRCRRRSDARRRGPQRGGGRDRRRGSRGE